MDDPDDQQGCIPDRNDCYLASYAKELFFLVIVDIAACKTRAFYFADTRLFSPFVPRSEYYLHQPGGRAFPPFSSQSKYKHCTPPARSVLVSRHADTGNTVFCMLLEVT